MTAKKIIALDTFNNTTFDLIDYYSQWTDDNKVIERIEKLIHKFELSVLDNPMIYPICQDIREHFGIIDYREFKYDGLKIIYRYDDINCIVYTMLLLSDKQDMQKKLIDYCLVYK